MFSFFLMAFITTRFFLLRCKLKWSKNGGTKVFIVTCIIFRITTFFIKYKSDIVFSVLLSLDQNLMKLEKGIITYTYLTNSRNKKFLIILRDGSRAAATSKMECFVVIVNGFRLLTNITKHSNLDVPAALDPSLILKTCSLFTL